MSLVLPFQRRESLAVLHVLPQVDQRIVDSLPELLAAGHGLSRIEVGGESFAVCVCGHVMLVTGEDWPALCGLQAAVDILKSEIAWRYRQTVERTLEAGQRDEEYLRTLSAESR